jgi:recombination protein RecA
VRIDIRRIGKVKEGEKVTGSRTIAKVVKNKVAAPFRSAEFDILYDRGISRTGDIVDLAVARNLITRLGTWYSYGEERIGQGREKAVQYLEENPSLINKLEEEILSLEGIKRIRQAQISQE